MSTFKCPVVRIGKFAKNPKSDTLMIWNGPQGPIQFKDGDYKEGDLAVFVPADAMVPLADDRFSHLSKTGGKDRFRVRGIRLRGLPSVGLLVHPPDGLNEGDDAAEALDIQKYEPPQTHSFHTNSLEASTPHGARTVPVYDVENPWNLEGCVVEGGTTEALNYLGVWSITEKIHGCNMKIYRDSEGVVHVGSRTRWVKDMEGNVWWEAYRRNQSILDQLLKANPNCVFFGEVYGKVQDLHYGQDKGVDLVLFDMFDTQTGRFFGSSKLYTELLRIPGGAGLAVPVIHPSVRGTLKEAIEYARTVCSGQSLLDKNTIREGVVIRLTGEDLLAYGAKTTRLMTKVVSPEYLSRKDGTEYQ